MNDIKATFAFLDGELARVTRLWDKVQSATGVTTKLPARVDGKSQIALALGMMPGPNFGIGRTAFTYVPFTTEGLTDTEVEAAMAHELGHFIAKDRGSNHATEFAADRWATERGYGPGLLSLLGKFARRFGPAGDETHPPYPLRVSNIKQVMGNMATKKEAV